MIRRTQSCARHKHLEFRVSYDALAVIEPDICWFMAGLENVVAQGERFSDGQTFQVGWMITLIRENEEGTLSILEPDMKAMPVKWIDSVSQTLVQLRRQKDVCESVHAVEALSFPSMRESALICSRFGQEDDFALERCEPKGTDSGWYCGCCSEQHDHQDVRELLRVSLFEAAVKYQPAIIPYLALPAGTLAQVSLGIPSIFFGEERIVFKPGSFLDRLCSADGV